MIGRTIVYIILIGLVVAMLYLGYIWNVRILMWLSGAGIVFLLYNLFFRKNE